VHETCGNGPDQQFIAFAPEREHDEHTPSLVRSPYGAKAALALRMGRIRENGERVGKKAFDFRAEIAANKIDVSKPGAVRFDRYASPYIQGSYRDRVCYSPSFCETHRIFQRAG
jgi:hypothetical protein